MKKHYVTKWEHDNRLYTTAACGQYVATISLITGPKATYRKNHVTCGNCRRILKSRDVR